MPPAHYDLPALKLTQDQHTVYLTSIPASILKGWVRHQILIVERFQRDQFGAVGGYQRGLSEQRAGELSRFVRGLFPTRQVILPMLPQTILLNARPGGGQPLFTPRSGSATAGSLRIFDTTRLAQVDGQHRIEGVLRAAVEEGTKWKFELPVAIVDELSLSQEAAQFLTINSKQTKVKMDLELRVIRARGSREADRLAHALGFEEWRLRALDITIALDDEPSPWQNSITGPDDMEREVISERTFVQSLSLACQTSRSIGRASPGEVRRFLADYWAHIGNSYPNAWGHRWPDYLLRRTTGVYAFHFIAPLVFDLCLLRHGRTDRAAISFVMDRVLTDRETAWVRGTGRFAGYGTGGAAWNRLANEFGVRLLPGYRIHPRSLSAVQAKADSSRLQRAVRQASTLLTPLGTREFKKANVDALAPTGSGGVYVLMSLDGRTGLPRRLYVGKSDSGLRNRLWAHRHDTTAWDLFSAQASSDLRFIGALEGALYHLAPNSLPHNNLIEPPGCPF